MHVARTLTKYVDKAGNVRRYESILVRRTFREGAKVRHETLANLSKAPAITSHCARRCLLPWFLTFDNPETLSDNDVRPLNAATNPRKRQRSPKRPDIGERR